MQQIQTANAVIIQGTTGVPKGIVHGQGGVLLKHCEEHMIQENVKPTDRMFFYTTTGSGRPAIMALFYYLKKIKDG